MPELVEDNVTETVTSTETTPIGTAIAGAENTNAENYESHQNSHNCNTVAKPMNTKNFVHSQLTNISSMWQASTESLDQILDDLGVYVILDAVAKRLARHPFLAFGLSAAFLSVTLPFIIFMMFTIITVIMTFTGFVIVEGTLITVASVMLFGFLGSVIVIFFFFGAIFLTGYFGFLHIYDLFWPGPKRAIRFVRPNGQRRFVNGDGADE